MSATQNYRLIAFIYIIVLFPLGILNAYSQSIPGATETGAASWYGGKFQGRLTANGEVFDTNKLTAAHRTLPFNTWVRVTNLENGLSVDVRINDRGPFISGRIIDLSRAAADTLNMVSSGVAQVRVEVIRPPERALSKEELPVTDPHRTEKELSAAEPPPEPRRPPQSAPSIQSSEAPGEYYIQVASFGQKENAARLVEELRSNNLESIMEPAGRYLRVIVPNIREKDLDSVRSKLASLGFPDVLVKK